MGKLEKSLTSRLMELPVFGWVDPKTIDLNWM